ncbi:MAG: winged helix-turn-helix domain-containing protein [Candidatus Bathyarchaeia archaeon]
MGIILEKDSPICRIGNETTFGKRYRSSFETIALILEAACRGASRFTIAKRLSTNYAQLSRYLTYLVKLGFINTEVSEKRFLYKTSKKGLEFLRLYHVILKMLLDAGETRIPAEIVCKSVHQKAVDKGRGRRGFGL